MAVTNVLELVLRATVGDLVEGVRRAGAAVDSFVDSARDAGGSALRPMTDGLTRMAGEASNVAGAVRENLGGGLGAVRSTLQDLGLGLEQHSGQIGKMEASYNQAGAAISKFIGLIGGGAAAMKAFDIASEYEAYRAQLKTAYGSAEASDQIFKDIQDFASKTPFQVGELTNAWIKLKSYGLSPTLDMMRDVGDAAAALGGAEVFSGITRALGQMQAKGRVMAEELLQLAENGVPVYQILQKQLGLTSEELQNIGKEGLSASRGIEALLTGFRELYGGGMAEMSAQAKGLLSNLMDSISLAADKLMNAGPMQAIKAELTGIIDWMGKIASDGRLDAWVTGIGGSIVSVWTEIKEFGQTLADVASPLVSLAGYLAPLAPALVDLALKWAGLKLAMTVFIDLPLTVLSSFQKLWTVLAASRMGELILQMQVLSKEMGLLNTIALTGSLAGWLGTLGVAGAGLGIGYAVGDAVRNIEIGGKAIGTWADQGVSRIKAFVAELFGAKDAAAAYRQEAYLLSEGDAKAAKAREDMTEAQKKYTESLKEQAKLEGDLVSLRNKRDDLLRHAKDLQEELSPSQRMLEGQMKALQAQRQGLEGLVGQLEKSLSDSLSTNPESAEEMARLEAAAFSAQGALSGVRASIFQINQEIERIEADRLDKIFGDLDSKLAQNEIRYKDLEGGMSAALGAREQVEGKINGLLQKRVLVEQQLATARTGDEWQQAVQAMGDIDSAVARLTDIQGDWTKRWEEFEAKRQEAVSKQIAADNEEIASKDKMISEISAKMEDLKEKSKIQLEVNTEKAKDELREVLDELDLIRQEAANPVVVTVQTVQTGGGAYYDAWGTGDAGGFTTDTGGDMEPMKAGLADESVPLMKKETADSTPSRVAVPSIPEVKVPGISVPEVKVPGISVPEVKVPDISVPEVKVPGISVPEVKVPDISVPEVKVPDISVDMKSPDLSSLFSEIETVKGEVAKISSQPIKMPAIDMGKIALPPLDKGALVADLSEIVSRIEAAREAITKPFAVTAPIDSLRRSLESLPAGAQFVVDFIGRASASMPLSEKLDQLFELFSSIPTGSAYVVEFLDKAGIPLSDALELYQGYLSLDKLSDQLDQIDSALMEAKTSTSAFAGQWEAYWQEQYDAASSRYDSAYNAWAAGAARALESSSSQSAQGPGITIDVGPIKIEIHESKGGRDDAITLADRLDEELARKVKSSSSRLAKALEGVA